MNLRPALLTAALLLSANAFANNPALSKDEFDQLIAQPFKATNGKSGLIVEIHLKPDIEKKPNNLTKQIKPHI